MEYKGISIGSRLIGSLNETAESARFLESLGYEFVSSGEHFMTGHSSDSHTILPRLAVAAGATSTLRLLSAILFFPMYHPTMIAKLVTTLDHASGGRLTLGIGVGGENPSDFGALGLSPRDRGSRTNEGLRLLRRLWTEDHVTHTGPNFPLEDITLNPKNVQLPHPPIWVAGRRNAAIKRAALLGDGWLPYFYSPQYYRESVDAITSIADSNQRDISQFQWGLFGFIAITETVEEGKKLAGEELARRYRSRRDPLSLAEDYAIYGPPEVCIKRMEEYIEAGVRFFDLNWVCPPEKMEENVKIAAKEILPHFARG